MSQKRIMYAPFNFSWVVPDKLACTGWPQNAANLRFLEKEGITHLITLSMERKPPIDDLPKGMKWSQIYIEEFKAPTVKEINQFIDICQRAHFTKDVIAVHCRQGRGRTGVMAACYLVRFQDFTPEMAIVQLRVMRPGSVETYKQERAVVKYYDALRGTIFPEVDDDSK
ncbi:dual specificity protein phosphatase 23-like isoform X2 [Cephus cinctus]|uniref:Dual specificity protein phosphatase 23 n=1 Tax=Cephus cinctus TaxID=211228 RepID=A0AAJ7BT43_CEPCN|nr:dual specificity protein phosphatase 23-like isoform X2 [Cephus cinctus]